MQVLKHIFYFYINSSIHVALAVCSLSYITLIRFDLPISIELLLFTFCASVSGYNFVKYFGLAKLHHRGLSNGLQLILIFSLLCFLVMLYNAFHLQLNTLLYLAILGAITFFYAIPFLPKKLLRKDGANLRAISGLKIYIIALVWAMVTVIVPLVNARYDIGFDSIITTIQRFLFVLVAMLPFEIRDMKYDSLKLGTLPQRLGVKNTKVLGVVLLMPFFFLTYFKDDVQAGEIIIHLIVMVLLMLSLWLSSIRRNRYFTLFWVEAIPLAWLGLMLLMIT